MPKIIKINHIRCNEQTAITYVAAPDEWSEEDAWIALSEAKRLYSEALTVAQAENQGKNAPPNDYRPYGGPPYKNYPNKTVAEIETEWENKRVVWQDWKDRQVITRKSFTSFLVDQGFIHLYDVDAIAEFECDWGHRHGTRIDYENTPLDTQPVPMNVVDPDWEDPDKW